MPNTTITPTDVITAYGSHYIDEGQNMSNLLMRPFEAFGTREAFTNVPTNETKLRYADIVTGEILQAYQDAYTAKGSVVFTPVDLTLQQVKIDQSFNPNNLVYSWLGFLTNNKVDRTQWPFIKWFVEEYLLKQVFKDIETKVIFKGEKVAVTPGTAGAAIEVMDGVKVLLGDPDITPIGVGAPPTDPRDFCVYMEEFCKGIDELYWDKKIKFNMSKTLRMRHREGRKLLYNMHYAQVSDLDKIDQFDNFSVAGRSSMKDSTNIWGTPVENAIFATKGFENAQGFEIEKEKRMVHIMTDFHIGLGFLLKDQVFNNGEGLA
jgi:hypothetical protein